MARITMVLSEQDGANASFIQGALRTTNRAQVVSLSMAITRAIIEAQQAGWTLSSVDGAQGIASVLSPTTDHPVDFMKTLEAGRTPVPANRS